MTSAGHNQREHDLLPCFRFASLSALPRFDLVEASLEVDTYLRYLKESSSFRGPRNIDPTAMGDSQQDAGSAEQISLNVEFS